MQKGKGERNRHVKEGKDRKEEQKGIKKEK
jgi:hypothetical protein